MSVTLNEIVTRIQQKFDGNSLYYDPISVLLLGINPAMNLLTLVRGNLLTKRTLLTVNAEASTFNLRSFIPRFWSVSRVVLGDMRGEVPALSNQRYKPLVYATIPQLAWKRDWLLRRGEPKNYWLWGDHWLGIHPRPDIQTQITVIHRSLPLSFTVNDLIDNPNREPEITEVHHEMICDLAVALVMVREGAGELDKIQQILQTLLSQEQLRGLRRLARQSMGVATGEATVAGATG